MIQVAFSPTFERNFRKRFKNDPQRQEKFWQRVEIFIHDPFDPRLKTHKLTGKLKELWSFTVEYDIRIIFYFLQNNGNDHANHCKMNPSVKIQ
jgi:mRNA-degrading endonuclease YafQ of YafQ-DinJ toxin-antitoxin module